MITQSSRLIAITMVLLIGCGDKPKLKGPNSELRRRYKEYIAAYEKMDYKKSYSMLSSKTRAHLSLASWRETVFRNAGKSKSKLVRIVAEPTGKRARVDIKEKNTEYSITWIKENGKWMRDYYSDRLARNNKTKSNVSAMSARAKSSVLAIKKAKKPDRAISARDFVLSDVELKWSQVQNESKKWLLRPELRYTVKNVSSQPIKYLRLKIVFRTRNGAEIDSVNESIIWLSDLPLPPGKTSKLHFTRSSIGFVVWDFGAGVSNRKSIISKPIAVSVYYVAKSLGKWQKYKVIKFGFTKAIGNRSEGTNRTNSAGTGKRKCSAICSKGGCNKICENNNAKCYCENSGQAYCGCE